MEEAGERLQAIQGWESEKERLDRVLREAPDDSFLDDLGLEDEIIRPEGLVLREPATQDAPARVGAMEADSGDFESTPAPEVRSGRVLHGPNLAAERRKETFQTSKKCAYQSCLWSHRDVELQQKVSPYQEGTGKLGCRVSTAATVLCAACDPSNVAFYHSHCFHNTPQPGQRRNKPPGAYLDLLPHPSGLPEAATRIMGSGTPRQKGQTIRRGMPRETTWVCRDCRDRVWDKMNRLTQRPLQWKSPFEPMSAKEGESVVDDLARRGERLMEEFWPDAVLWGRAHGQQEPSVPLAVCTECAFEHKGRNCPGGTPGSRQEAARINRESGVQRRWKVIWEERVRNYAVWSVARAIAQGPATADALMRISDPCDRRRLAEAENYDCVVVYVEKRLLKQYWLQTTDLITQNTAEGKEPSTAVRRDRRSYVKEKIEETWQRSRVFPLFTNSYETPTQNKSRDGVGRPMYG